MDSATVENVIKQEKPVKSSSSSRASRKKRRSKHPQRHSFNGVGQVRLASVEMIEALASLEGPARPALTSDEESESRRRRILSDEGAGKSAVVRVSAGKDQHSADDSDEPNNNITDDEEYDADTDRETGHNSDADDGIDDDAVETASFHTAGNTSQIVSPTSEFNTPSATTPDDEYNNEVHYGDQEVDRRSVASTVVAANRSRDTDTTVIFGSGLEPNISGAANSSATDTTGLIIGPSEHDGLAAPGNNRFHSGGKSYGPRPIMTSTPTRRSRGYTNDATGGGDDNGDAGFVPPSYSAGSTTTPPPLSSLKDIDNPANPMYHTSPYRSGDILNDAFDEEDAEADDYERAEREYSSGERQPQRGRYSQEYNYNVSGVTPPRNIYDAALRGEYSNNYGEQSCIGPGGDADRSLYTDSQNDQLSPLKASAGGLQFDDDEEIECGLLSPMPIDENNDANSSMFVDSGTDEQPHDSRHDDNNAQPAIEAGSGIQASSSSLGRIPDDFGGSSAMQHSPEPPAENDGQKNNLSLNSADDTSASINAADVDAVLSPSTSSSKQSQTAAVQQSHEWIDIFANGDLVKKTLRDSASDAARPQHRSQCVVSYDAYKLQLVGAYDYTENDDNEPPRDAVVFARIDSKRIVVGEADDIPALDILLRMMRRGEKIRAVIKPRFGYGERGWSELGVPGSATLLLDIELLDILLSGAPPETDAEYRNSPELLLALAEQKKLAGNSWFGIQMYIPAATAWQAGIHYVDAALAAMPGYLLNTLASAEVADVQCDRLREQILALKAILYSNMSLAQLKQQTYDACLRSCNEALKLDPNLIKCHVRKGKVLGLLDKHQQAVEVLREARINVESKYSKSAGKKSEKDADEEHKWRQEIDELMLKSSTKLKQQTQQEQEMYKRMLGGLSPESSAKKKKKQKQLAQQRADAALKKQLGEPASGGGSLRDFFSRYRNVIVASSFVAVTVGVIAGVYFLKHNSLKR